MGDSSDVESVDWCVRGRAVSKEMSGGASESFAWAESGMIGGTVANLFTADARLLVSEGERGM